MVRGVHGPGWIELRDFFDPTQKFLLRLITQPNPKIFTTQPNPLFSSWVGFFGWLKKIIFLKLVFI